MTLTHSPLAEADDLLEGREFTPDQVEKFSLTLGHAGKRAYLKALAMRGTVKGACREINMSRGTVLYWRETDAGFKILEPLARDVFAEALEEEAIRRATVGNRRYKFDKNGNPLRHPDTGEPYWEDTQSDLLMIFLLKGAKPEKYKDRAEVAHVEGAPTGESSVMAERLLGKLALLAQRQNASAGDPTTPQVEDLPALEPGAEATGESPRDDETAG